MTPEQLAKIKARVKDKYSHSIEFYGIGEADCAAAAADVTALIAEIERLNLLVNETHQNTSINGRQCAPRLSS